MVKFLIYFRCSNEVMTQRILKRGESSGRADDNPETIKKRIDTFERESLPVIDKFRNEEKIIEVDAEKPKE